MRQSELARPGSQVSGYTIFDLLFFGGAFLLFALFCLGLEKSAEGMHPFLRLSQASPTAICLVAVFSAIALAAGSYFLLRRLLARKEPQLPGGPCAKKTGPGLLESLADACKQLVGAKVVVETEEDRRQKAEEEALKARKRNLRGWLRQDKTRMAATSALLFLTIYLTPRDLLLRMGTHALLLYLVQFASFVGAFMLAIISWVEPT